MMEKMGRSEVGVALGGCCNILFRWVSAHVPRITTHLMDLIV